MSLTGRILTLGLSLMVLFSGCQTYESRMTLPEGRYLEHPPQYFPPSPEFPLQRELAPPEQGKTVTLVVANVHKEDVNVFAVEPTGLRFVRRLKAGEAVDLTTTPGMRWAATFNAAPHCVNFTARGISGEVWLLRPQSDDSTVC